MLPTCLLGVDGDRRQSKKNIRPLFDHFHKYVFSDLGLRLARRILSFWLLHSAGVKIRNNRTRLGKPFWNVNARVENDITPRVERPGPDYELRFCGELREDFEVRKSHQLHAGEDPVHFFF